MGVCASSESKPEQQEQKQPAKEQQQAEQPPQALSPSSAPSAPPLEEEEERPQNTAEPQQVQLNNMGTGSSHAREVEGSAAYAPNAGFQSTAEGQAHVAYPPGGAAPVMPLMGSPPGAAAASFPAAQAGASFSPWNADGASAERNRAIALMLKTIHDALLDEPQTSESLRMRAQQALRQSEREVEELHALPRLHGLHFKESNESAVISSLDAKSPATTAPFDPLRPSKANGVKPDLHKGDRVLAIEGIQVIGANHALMLLNSQLCLPGQSVDLTIQRGSSALPLHTKLIMGSDDASPFDLEQRHSRIATNLDFVRSLRAEVEAQKELDARTAIDRAREEAAVARAVELARQRAREQEEAERYSEVEAALVEQQHSTASRARKIAERADRVEEASQELAFRSMMLVLAKVASASSSSLAAGAASAHAPVGAKEALKMLLVQALPASGTVEAALFGEENMSVRNADAMAAASTAPMSSTPLPNSKLALAELQQHIVTRLLTLGPGFVSQPASAQRAQVDGVLAEWRLVQQQKSVAEAARAEELRLQALRASDARHLELEQLQRQIAASKHAAIVAAADMRRMSADKEGRQPGAPGSAPGAPAPAVGWEGMPVWSNH